MKVLLTGHSGFIGQSLLKLLLKKKTNLYVTKHNKLLIPKKSNISVIDLKKKNTQLISFDIVIHAAWSKLDNYNSLDHSKKIFPENYKFLSKLINLGLKNLVVLGTCFEIGNCNGEVNEKIKMKPITKYGFAKKKLLLKLMSLQKKKNFTLTWARIFYLYGENQRKKSLFKQIENHNKKKNKVVFKMTSGNQTRDYINVDSLSKKIIRIAFLKKNIGIVNVCSGTPVSIKKLVLQWKNRYKWDIKFNFGSKTQKKYEPYNFWGSTKKLKNVLNRS